MKDYSGLNAARLRTLLREHDLDHPLTDMDLALRILDIESRLDVPLITPDISMIIL